MIDRFVITLERHEIYAKQIEIWLDLKSRINNKTTQITKQDKKTIRKLSRRIHPVDYYNGFCTQMVAE